LIWCVITREFAAKGQEEVFKRELITRLASVHVENPGRLFGGNVPICVHSTGENCSDRLRCKRSGISQEALLIESEGMKSAAEAGFQIAQYRIDPAEFRQFVGMTPPHDHWLMKATDFCNGTEAGQPVRDDVTPYRQ
jgi:hypothetical protein